MLSPLDALEVGGPFLRRDPGAGLAKAADPVAGPVSAAQAPDDGLSFTGAFVEQVPQGGVRVAEHIRSPIALFLLQPVCKGGSVVELQAHAAVPPADCRLPLVGSASLLSNLSRL